MERIYCIIGLGADHRLFKRLSVPGYELAPVPWATINKDEGLSAYAKKLAATIPGTNPIILGLSFGGMCAVEIARIREVKKVIIISSAKTKQELSLPVNGLSRWIINKGLIPAKWFNIPSPVALKYLGAKTPEEKQMLREIIHDSDGLFMKRALKAIINWQNDFCPANVVHIHGTTDKVIHSVAVKPDHWIEKGKHIMIYNRADEISKIISGYLAG